MADRAVLRRGEAGRPSVDERRIVAGPTQPPNSAAQARSSLPRDAEASGRHAAAAGLPPAASAAAGPTSSIPRVTGWSRRVKRQPARYTAGAMFPVSDVIPSRTKPFVTIGSDRRQYAGFPLRAPARPAPALRARARRSAWSRPTSTGRAPSPARSCTTAGSTSAGTCSISGSSATTSRTRWGTLRVRRVLSRRRGARGGRPRRAEPASIGAAHRRERRGRGDSWAPTSCSIHARRC